MSRALNPGSGASLLVIGCGDLGSGVALACRDAGWQVWGARRSPGGLPPGITPLALDVTAPATLAPLAALDPDVVLVTLTPGGFSDERYRAIYVDGLRHLLAALRRPRRLLWVSSTSVYHQDDGSVVDETSPTLPSGFSGQRLLEAEQLLASCDWPTTAVRLGGIYGPGRDRLLRQLQAGERSPPQPRRISNRIHRDDAVSLLCFLAEQAAAGVPLDDCYVGVDTAPTPIHEVEAWFAEWLGLPAAPPAATPLLRGGNRICSSARLQALGYRFRYPTFREGLPTLLGEAQSSVRPPSR